MAVKNTITSANSVIMLAVTGLIPIPVQLSGFDTDDIYGIEEIDAAEVKMGVDGNLSAGFINVAVPQTFHFQADSKSISFFEALYTAEKAAQDKYFIQGTTILTSVGSAYVMTNGVLTKYSPMPAAGKVLKPRAFTVTWEKIIGAPI